MKKIENMLYKLSDKIDETIKHVENIQPDESDWSAWDDRQFYRNEKNKSLENLHYLNQKIDIIFKIIEQKQEDK